MEKENDFYEPSSSFNFLQRYHSTKSKPAAESTAESPALQNPASTAAKDAVGAGSKLSASSPKLVTKKSTQDVWSSVFHPLGRSPTGKSQFDTAPPAGSGVSTSELYERGSSTIYLDRKDE
mmetsp:Transcript_12829/g.34540  ORF Transcript_12829/g.34540 Transcript_12829/m.34540 type:complete len:121 (-) Transcript_12829:223-585(-)|eukprot:CAMPEP_0185835444 /NCGR_PEP_ID=MMETSP1353-20130828/7777_1 /TAXON_ID=1077150 /ORGANISM="Erythrolobus australicus, Strain CCMP3124" /LENGTH=120 /DNA_ID=CAMNT_0028534071 /DNA_START=131 /DNA_END=493 /DNA_ORIENTATION=-